MRMLKFRSLLIAVLATIILCTTTLAKLPLLPQSRPTSTPTQTLIIPAQPRPVASPIQTIEPLQPIPTLSPLPTLPKLQPLPTANVDYVRSLFAADKFLYAWKTRNTQEGLALVSPLLRSKKSEDELFNYISGTSSPSHAAFEVSSGKRLPDGRYSFDVKLYEYYYAATPEKQSWSCPPKLSRIVLSKSGVVDSKFRVGTWLVDELPQSCELVLS